MPRLHLPRSPHDCLVYDFSYIVGDHGLRMYVLYDFLLWLLLTFWDKTVRRSYGDLRVSAVFKWKSYRACDVRRMTTRCSYAFNSIVWSPCGNRAIAVRMPYDHPTITLRALSLNYHKKNRAVTAQSTQGLRTAPVWHHYESTTCLRPTDLRFLKIVKVQTITKSQRLRRS